MAKKDTAKGSPGKKKKKPIILILIVLIVVLAGAFFGLAFSGILKIPGITPKAKMKKGSCGGKPLCRKEGSRATKASREARAHTRKQASGRTAARAEN